jgi:hypothetical protein
MSEYNKISEGYFTSTGVAKFLNLPFVPDQIEIWNKTKWATNTNNLVKYATGFSEDAAGTAYAIISDGSAHDNNATLVAGGFTFISAGTYQYGPTITISGITQAASAVVTTSSPHGLATGDSVLIYGTTGMLQISPAAYTVTVLSTTTFSIPVNSSGFAAAATAGFMKQILYPDLYVPYGTVITAISTGTTTTITTALNHGFVVGQEVFFVIPTVSTTAWGTTQLDTLAYNTANAVPQQAYVTSVPAANQIVVNVNSTGYTAFAYPTSAQAALGMTFPQVVAIGDQNSGISGSSAIPPVTPPITIPGAYYANTRQGVIIGTGNGTQIMHQTNDVVRWRAIFPDQVKTS